MQLHRIPEPAVSQQCNIHPGIHHFINKFLPVIFLKKLVFGIHRTIFRILITTFRVLDFILIHRQLITSVPIRNIFYHLRLPERKNRIGQAVLHIIRQFQLRHCLRTQQKLPIDITSLGTGQFVTQSIHTAGQIENRQSFFPHFPGIQFPFPPFEIGFIRCKQFHGFQFL